MPTAPLPVTSEESASTFTRSPSRNLLALCYRRVNLNRRSWPLLAVSVNSAQHVSGRNHCGNSVQYGYKTKHVVYQNVQCIKQAHTTSFASSNLTPPRGGRFSISITVNGLIDGRWLESSTLFSVNVLMRTCNPCLGSEKLLPEYEPLSGKIFVDRFA